jgi:protein-disulfide isomerase
MGRLPGHCPYCGRAEPVIRGLVHTLGRYPGRVFRHLPFEDVHAALAAEAACAQGKFWEMHDLLLAHQDALTVADLHDCARQLG